MATRNSWDQRISAFLLSPSQFLSCTTPDSFLSELLDELRDDKPNDYKKILLLKLLLEYPTVLCATTSVGEGTAQELMSVLSLTPQKSVNLKCHLLLAITNILICTSCLDSQAKAAEDYTNFLFSIIQDTNDNAGGPSLHLLRVTACDCLREMEFCHPGLLSQKLETLYYLKQQETTALHQSYCMLYTRGLKNAIHLLTLQNDVDNAKLRGVLGGNEGFAWKSAELPLCTLPFSSMSHIPQLPTALDCKELKSILSLLLEESYLMTPTLQAAVLRELVEVVAMIPAVPPVIFKSQLLRLFGTMEVELMHAALLMKGTFTDSLFTTEDENFLLKRLVSMAQHPLLGEPDKQFYMDCVLHFPENRPISSSGEEGLPVLVTPRLTLSLLPTVFKDSTTMLCQMHLLSLVHLEADGGDEDRGLTYLFNHLMALLKIVENNGSKEMVVTTFRVSFIFLTHFHHMERFSEKLVDSFRQLYLRHGRLAPHLINLVDRIQECLAESLWPVQLLRALQKSIVEMPLLQLTLQDLSWHLKVLGRAAQESQIGQRSTVVFILNILINSNLCERRSWQVGNSILAVCRHLLQHPTLSQMFTEMADLLQHMSRNYEDTDIQDHARFYYTLTTNLCWAKLAGVLAKGPEGRQTKVRSWSAILADSEGLTNCLNVHQTDGCVLQLSETHEHIPRCEETVTETLKTPHEKGLFELYQEQLKTSGCAVQLTLRYSLTHAKGTDPRFDRIFTICLHFDTNTSHYEDVSDIHVPCLFRDRKPPVVELSLKLRQPFPTSLRLSAIFTTEDGLSWHTQMPDVDVSFPEIFLPVPLPLGTSRECKEEVFDHIWKSTSSGEPSSSATSLFCFKTGSDALADLIKGNFEDYLVAETWDQSVWKVFTFLPPLCHVLLMIVQAEDACQIHIATDNWELLPHIGSYLQNITALSKNPASS
ncbi:AP-5 complex subunit beta-1 [Electrophorus electricus]|uniref:AP-5 complex subunit beta-1 n=1 Tax=Electrophorus electricus TaxID=8005 RepID=A0AAY5EWV5_ELEEL|nr:AP-5 complex subunit beta-1 [Electrophorus electricus]XP_035376251.1 AP-5 complex subunit beta-1 [Electrophorus electricus]